MSHQIAPLILQKLQAFSLRRRRLIIIRGVCAGLAMLLATMMAVALVDWLFVLPDWLRWSLSGVAYAAVIIVEWRSCLRLLMHAPGPRRLARLIEHAEPKLREDLISAVELGDPNSDAAFDSEQFRELVQSDVSHRMEGMEVERLLPVNLVRRYLTVAAIIIIALIAGFAATGLQFGTLLARALLPGANLARVSKFHVTIVSPDPAEKIVPHGETVPLVASVGGGRVSKAVLEIFSATGGREVVQMTPLEGDHFSATIQVGRENVRYRVRAGDAITRKYQLDAVARPHVVAFAKTYKFPEYAQMPDKQVREENGDLIGLEGSTAELRLETNQPIASGELRLDQGRQQTTVPLAVEANGQLVGQVPMKTSGNYRVFLVGARTGFENKFSPEYEIRAEPDLVPQVEMESPKQDLIVPANEIIDVRGTASDDLALAKVAQLVRVNQGPWKEIELVKNPGPKAEVERHWDLFEQGAKAGDLISTKLLAVDLKGNRAESRPVQLTITASGFESKRLTSLDTQRQLYQTFAELRTAADAFDKQTREARELFERVPDGDPQRRQASVSAVGAIENLEPKITAAWTQLDATLRPAAAGHESHDLVLAGRLLSKMNTGALQHGRALIEAISENPSPVGAREMMREFGDLSARATQRARLIEESYRVFLNAEEIDVITENMLVVSKEQARLNQLARGSGDDAKKWAPLADRLRTVASQTRLLEGQMTQMAEHSKLRDRLRQMLQQIEKPRAELETGLASGAADKRLLDPTQKLASATDEAARRFLELKREMTQPPIEKVHDLWKEIGATWVNFENLRDEVKRGEKLPGEWRARIVDRRWDLRSAAFKEHGDLEEARGNSDSYFVADLRATNLALLGLKTAGTPPERDKKLGELDLSFRLLESGHNLAETLDGFNHLAVGERWDVYHPRVRTTNSRDWHWLEDRLRVLPDELGKTQQPEATHQIIMSAQRILWEAQKQPSWKALADEMQERLRPERAPMPLPQDAEKLAALVKQALDLLRAPMEDARKLLAEMAPKVSELASQLAKKTEELKNETAQQAEKTAAQKPEEANAQAQQQLAQQQQLNQQVETLKDLIRAEANKQDILEKEGREAARDADDALALLKEPPPKAEQALQEAAHAEAPELAQQAMQQAAAEQQKLQDALGQIAEHFENAEQGKPEETRMALRATEDQTGVKAQLDAQFARAEELAQMAQQSPEELLKQLEQALPRNPEMRKELSQISQDALTAAQERLAQAARSEQQVAQDLEQMRAQPEGALPKTVQEAARQAVAAAEAARQAADEAVQMAKQSQNPAAADQARQARRAATEARQNAEQAAQAAEQMAQPNQAREATAQTAQKANDAAQNAQQAAEAAAQAQQSAQQAAAQLSGDQQAKNQQTSKEAAEAQQAARAAAQAAKMTAAMAQAQTRQMAAQPSPQTVQEAARQAVAAAEAARQAADEAVQAAKQAENSAAADQGRQARAEAMEARQAAEQALQSAQQMAQPNQAAQAAQMAAQQANQAARDAQQAAQAATQAQQTAQQSAAQQSGDQQARNQQASREAGEAVQAARQAARAAQMAAALAQGQTPGTPQTAEQGTSPQGQQSNPQLAQAAQQQPPIAANANEAGQNISRAGRHEERLQNVPAGAQLQQLGSQIERTAQQQVPAAQQALSQAQQAQQAQSAVNTANNELATELRQLQAAAAPQQSPPGESSAQGQQGPTTPAPSAQGASNPQGQQTAQSPGGRAPSGQPASSQNPLAQMPPLNALAAAPAAPEEQVWMARTLDALDTALHAPATASTAQSDPQGQPTQSAQGQPGQPQPGQPQNAAAQAMAQAQAAMNAAARATANSMRSARAETPSKMPSGVDPKSDEQAKSQNGALAQAPSKAYQSPAEAKNLKAGDWGKLPKQVAEQLTQGQREAVASEYRNQIETYYRVIAERAKKP